MSKLLNTVKTGAKDGVPLIIAHGLFGSARNWGVLSKRLGVARPVVAVDMRNHGNSFHHPSNTYDDLANDLALVIEANGGVADVLGHSMGGKAAMVLALSRPELVRSLVVADIAPVSYSHSQSDKIAAMQVVDLSTIENRRDADSQLAQNISEPVLRSFLLQSLSLNDGDPHWRLNLDALNNNMQQIIGFCDVNGSYNGPSLFLRGKASDYVLPEHEAKIGTLFPNYRIETIDNAGHWLHAENPRAFEQAVSDFLE